MNYSFWNIRKEDSPKLELLKYFLLLQVVVGHAIALSIPQMSNIPLDSIKNILLVLFKILFSFGRESAFLFIFLSGFFTAKTFLNFDQSFSLVSVLWKRVKRIYPIFITALLITALLDYVGMNLLHFDVYNSNQVNYVVEKHFSLNLFLTNLFSLQPTFSMTDRKSVV